MATRSGPSARTTAWVARRQTKRAGGPSGTCAMTFINSGRSNSRSGRSGGSPSARAADTRGDAVDQGGQFVVVVHIGIEIALLLHHDFGAAGGQPNEIEAETGVEGITQRIEPLAEQAVAHPSP